VAYPTYEIIETLTGALPSQAYILPVVDDLDHVTIETGSSVSPDPVLDSGRLVTIAGQYLKIRVTFLEEDWVRKLYVFRIE